jgi:uncharacterized membrane protein
MADAPRWLSRFLAAGDLDAIARAVTEAEAGTSGEVRVHLEPHVPHARIGRTLSPTERAEELFTALGMTETQERNGVLIYLALKDHKMAIVGDRGIHARVGPAYWDRVRDLLVSRLRDATPREALVAAVADVGRVLRQHFPRRPDDVNELGDRVSLEE